MREVATMTVDPATLAPQCWTAAGNDRMHVSVRFQLLIPGVQHHGGGRFKTLFCFDHLVQGSPGRPKQQCVDRPPVAQRERTELVGNREDDLEVIDAGQ